MTIKTEIPITTPKTLECLWQVWGMGKESRAPDSKASGGRPTKRLITSGGAFQKAAYDFLTFSWG